MSFSLDCNMNTFLLLAVIVVVIVLIFNVRCTMDTMKERFDDVFMTGCEGNSNKASCPNGQTFTDKSQLIYGRWDNSVCPHSTVNDSTAPNTKIFPLPATCLGQNSCTIEQPNVMVGNDPYPGVYKQVAIAGVCQ